MFRFSKLLVVSLTSWADASFRARDFLLDLAPATFPQVSIQRSSMSLDCQLRLRVQLVCCWNRRSLPRGTVIAAHYAGQVADVLLFSVFRDRKTK